MTITGKENLLGAFVEAFLMEKGTKEFYVTASEKSKTPEAKNMFHSLSEWEQKHMDFLQFLYQSVQGDREMQSFKDFSHRSAAPDTESGIPVTGLEKRFAKVPVNDEETALSLAMEIEGRAYNLYHRLSQSASDSGAKMIFQEMMEQEVKHVDYLKQIKQRRAGHSK